MRKKIIEFSSEPFMLRRDFWKKHLSEFAQIDFVEFFEGRAELKAKYQDLVRDADGALVTEPYSKIFFEIFQLITRDVLETRKIDALIKEKGGVWPFCLMREALHELIVSHAPQLDTHMKAYISGSDSTMRVSLSTVVQMGFREINVIVDEPEMVQPILAELSRQFLGVQVDIIRNTELTLQPNNGSILINTIRLEGRTELIDDLSYLNFIAGNGIVVDTSLYPLRHQLLDEALNVGLRVLSGAEIKGLTDYLFLKRIFGELSISSADYIKAWITFLQDQEVSKNAAKVQ